jgi:hypothetical protein
MVKKEFYMLTENDFKVLRFKLAKLLKTKEKRIKKIDLCEDDSIFVHTGFGYFPIKFINVNEINNDFEKFYPDIKIPNHLIVVESKIKKG